MVTSTDAIKLYNGDGVTTRFPITLEHTSEDDIKIESIHNETGEYTEIAKDSGWTYTVDGEAVYCDLVAALSSDYKLMISLDIPGTQPIHLIDGAPYVPNVLEKALDRFTLRDNQIMSKLNGSMTAPLEEGQESMKLPPAAARAGKFLYFDENGLPSVDPNVVAKPTSDFMQGVLTQETAKAAKSSLETDKNNVNAVDDDYVVLDNDDYEVIEATGGADGITITLPTLADNAGRVLKILKVDADPGVITIDGEDEETINGEDTQVLAAQHEAITVIAGTTEWKVLNAGKKTSLTVAAKSTDYTITDTDNIDILEVTTGATDKTVTLPTLADNQGRSITIKKADEGDGAVVIDGEGAETIQGVADFSMVSQFESITIYAGPTEWGVSSYDSKDGTGGEIGDVKWVLHDIEKNGWKNARYQSRSQNTYAEFWGIIGHGYAKSAADAATAQALGEFRFPDGRYLFPRAGTQSWPLTPSAFDTGTDQITITDHGLETDGSQNGRPMKLLRVPGQSPTLPTGTGYTEYDQNYVRVIDADTIELYDTEAHAIDTSGKTGRVDWTAMGSGVFKLTTQGCYQADAMQGFNVGSKADTSGPRDYWGGAYPRDNAYSQAAYAAGSTYPIMNTSLQGDSKAWVPMDDGIDGEPRLTNETRGAFVSMNMQIKVIGTSVSTGEAYDLLAYNSGWLAVPAAGNTVVIPHELNTDYDDLLIEVLGKAATGETGEMFSFQNTGGTYNVLTHLSNNDPYSFLMVRNGGTPYINIASNILVATEMKIKVYKPSLFAVTKTSPLVTVTESGPVTIETVEKTVVIPASITSSLDITLIAGAGINETNCIWIKNKSDEIQRVLYSTQTFKIAPGQKVKFYLEGTTLVWASAGWETIHDDPSSTDTSITLPVEDNCKYEILLGGTNLHTANMLVNKTLGTQSTGTWANSYYATYVYATDVWGSGLAGYYWKRIRKWHDAA